MYQITIPKADVSSEAVAQALRDGLGPNYNVLPGMRLIRAPFSEPVAGSPDTIVVGTGNNRVWRAQVSITRASGQTELRVTPGGLISDFVLNAVGIARKTRRVLATAPGLA
jgi:hypothetical protein